jgi:hypothetical protein
MTKHIVSERALIGRVRRKLARKNQLLTVAREDGRLHSNVGRFSIWDSYTNALLYSHVKLQGLARELGVMHSDEVLA